MILFCTFGTVQSFGVYQAYYSVGISRSLHPAHLSRPSSVTLPFGICRERYQLDWFSADLLTVCWRFTRREAV